MNKQRCCYQCSNHVGVPTGWDHCSTCGEIICPECMVVLYLPRDPLKRNGLGQIITLPNFFCNPCGVLEKLCS